MASYHGKKDASLKTFFRQQTKAGRAERNKWLQCIICGSCQRNGHQVAKHMMQSHSRLHLLKFNVHWICDWYYVFESPVDFCPRLKKKISMLQLAEHSSKCEVCSVLKPLLCVVQKICDTFDDWSKKEENLEAICEATEILHGLEKLTKSNKWKDVH